LRFALQKSNPFSEPGESELAAISLGLLALMIVLPFLIPLHTAPIGSFWAEWSAGVLGLGAAIGGLFASRNISGSRTLTLPIVLLVPAALLLTIVIQFAFGRLAFPQLGLLFAIYLIWAALLMVLGRNLADSVGLARLVDILAIALVFGSAISAGIAMLQWLGMAGRLGLIFPASGSLWANVAQGNHFGHYCWLGVTSIFYLRGRGYLSRTTLWFLTLPVAYASTASNSRSVFLYLIVFLAAIAWLRRDNLSKKDSLATDAALLVPVFFALSLVGYWLTPRIPELWPLLTSDTSARESIGASATAINPTSSGAKLISGDLNTVFMRLAFIRPAWEAFIQHPFLGQGIGNFRWASFTAAANRTDDSHFLVAEHAHNIVVHLLAEVGGPAVAVVVLSLATWAVHFARAKWQLEHFWIATIVGIGVVHSMLEYPWWYSYFLGPTALLLGATSRVATFALAGNRVTAYLLAMLLAGSLTLEKLRTDYSAIEAAVAARYSLDQDRQESWWASIDSLLMLHEESLLSPWALREILILAEPSTTAAKERAEFCAHAIKFTAERTLVTRCAVHLSIAGRDAEARELVKNIGKAYPAERTETSEELEKTALAFPRIRALWELSLK
jgi:hypothetical protein